MAKFTSAHFSLECIVKDGEKSPSYILRDRNGNICVIGSIDDVEEFLTETFNSFIAQKETQHGNGEN